MRIGIVGLGQMGSAIAGRLLAAGHDVWVHNRTPEKASGLLADGARWADDPAALAEQVELAISMVADDRALEDVALGERGLLAVAHPSLTYVDMSTVSVNVSTKVARAAEVMSVDYLRAPVTGGTVLAQQGSVGVLVSGPKTALDKYDDIFSVIGKSVFHLGDGEEARVMKLALNIVVASTVMSLSEALVLGERSGLDWQGMLDVFSDSAVGSPLMRYKAAQLSTRDFSPAFTTSMMSKDLGLALDLAHETGSAAPATAVCRELLHATIGSGWGDHDFASTILLLEQLSARSATETPKHKDEER